jgi:hypothetical protein
MDLTNDELEQHAAADRREGDPPIEVQTATWTKAGQLDSWVKDRQEWWGRVRGADSQSTVGLLICVPRAAHSHNL